MPKFSQKSLDQLNTCNPLLQQLFNEVIKTHDCTIIEGYRDKEKQEAAFAEGKTQLHYPFGNHNKNPSLAVDVMPYPIDWNDSEGIKNFSDFVKATAKELNISIGYGGDWKTFKDRDHYELVSAIQAGQDAQD